MSARTPTLLTELLLGFPQLLQEHSVIQFKTGHDRFLQRHVQFVIH